MIVKYCSIQSPTASVLKRRVEQDFDQCPLCYEDLDGEMIGCSACTKYVCLICVLRITLQCLSDKKPLLSRFKIALCLEALKSIGGWLEAGALKDSA